jgi:hypothetical protein
LVSAEAPLGRASRQHVGRVAPQRLGIGIAQIAAGEPNVRQHPVVEFGQAHGIPAVLETVGKLLEPTPGAAAERG